MYGFTVLLFVIPRSINLALPTGYPLRAMNQYSMVYTCPDLCYTHFYGVESVSISSIPWLFHISWYILIALVISNYITKHGMCICAYIYKYTYIHISVYGYHRDPSGIPMITYENIGIYLQVQCTPWSMVPRKVVHLSLLTHRYPSVLRRSPQWAAPRSAAASCRPLAQPLSPRLETVGSPPRLSRG